MLSQENSLFMTMQQNLVLTLCDIEGELYERINY